PTGNLDDQTAKGIFDLLKSIHELGTTVIMATHNSNFLDDSTHHLHLEKGKITSTPAKTNPRPKKKKVTK
ncbi:hypothetical protein HY333_00185, partial [Candidatus Collierbacteria bacterium]|nr:hypothetical protein [Candidatus Collierbacteria bacterium]